MPSYKLIYFDGRGRAELCRLLFTLAGQDYEDVRIEAEKWPQMKPTTPFGSLPVLEIDGKKFAQSMALASYLARELGFYGKNNLESLEIDQVLGLVTDLLNAGVKATFEPDEAKKAELLKNFKDVEYPKFMAFFEKLLKEKGTGYFVGNSLTLADMAVFDLTNGMSLRQMTIPDKFPLVKALYNKIENRDKIKVYLDNRKETQF